MDTRLRAPPQTLADLQHAFQQHLLNGVPDGEPAIAQAVVAGPGVGTPRRLAIYRNAYRARLGDALRDTYGHTARYLGDDWFDRDAQAYIEATPSRFRSLNDYGADLSTWLAQRHPNDLDIAELAALDWALRRAFDGPDAPVLTLADLAAVAPADWAHVGFALHPTTARLTFTHNALALWTALDRDETPPPAQRLAQPADLLVWRRGHSPHFRSLGALEACALAMLEQGAGFAAVCAQLAGQFPEADIAVEAGSLLRRWVEEGLLSALTPRPAAPR